MKTYERSHILLSMLWKTILLRIHRVHCTAEEEQQDAVFQLNMYVFQQNMYVHVLSQQFSHQYTTK